MVTEADDDSASDSCVLAVAFVLALW